MPEPTRPAPDAPTPPDAGQLAALQTRIAELALATPGVADLNPTLLASLRRLRLPQLDQQPVDLVCHGRTADVSIALTTRADHPARTTCRQLHAEISTAVIAAGLTPGTIHLHVSTIEPVP